MLQPRTLESETWIAGDPDGSIFLPDEFDYARNLTRIDRELILRRGSAARMSLAETEAAYERMRIERAMLIETGRVAVGREVIVK